MLNEGLIQLTQFSYQTKATPPYQLIKDFENDLWIVIELRKAKQYFKEDVYAHVGSGYSCNSCRLLSGRPSAQRFCSLGGFFVGWRSGCIEHTNK